MWGTVRANMIQQAAQALIDGTDGGEVISELSKTHRTLGSLNGAMSLVRSEVMGRGHLPSYDDSELRKHADNPDVQAFLDAPLKDQVAIKRAHAYRPTWSDDAEAALDGLKLLPESMASFRLTKEQNLELKQAHKAALVSRNERVVTINDADKMLKRARELLETAKTTDTFAKIVLPLALVTGRRMSELLGGHARFDRTDDPHFVLFSGQLKKRAKAAPYKIPILCDVDTLHHAYGMLRKKQAEKGVTTQLTPNEVKRKYHGQLQYYIKDGRTLPQLPTWSHFHDLRSCYSSYVFECFHVRTTFQRMAMAILGHDSIHESLSYGHVRLQNATVLRGALGQLQM